MSSGSTSSSSGQQQQQQQLQLSGVTKHLWTAYRQSTFTVHRSFILISCLDTPARLQIIDAYLVFVMLSGIAQFVYCLLVGTFPYNAFLSGFASCVGAFVLAGMNHLLLFIFQKHLHYFWIANLRIQSNPENAKEFPQLQSAERAFGDYIFCSLVLYYLVVQFIG